MDTLVYIMECHSVFFFRGSPKIMDWRIRDAAKIFAFWVNPVVVMNPKLTVFCSEPRFCVHQI